MTPAIEAYVEKRLEPIARLLKRDSSAMIAVEVGKSTKHHNKGPYFFAEYQLEVGSASFRAKEQQEDLYAAVDVAQGELKRQIVEWKKKFLDQRRKVVRSGKK